MRWTAALVLVAACGFRSPDSSNTGDAARPGDGSDVPPGAWWDPAWSSRMRIVIENTAPLPQGFQLGLPRDLDMAPCNDSRDAVRVVRDHTDELPRVIDELGGASDEWIWFKLAAPLPAAAGASEYWMYCGNVGAGAAPSDPTAVFDAFDSFEGTTLSSAWRSQGQVSVGGGVVTLGGNNIGIHSAAAYGPGTATDFVLQASSSAIKSPWFWGGFEVGFTTAAPWVIWHATNDDMIRQEIFRTGSAVTANERETESGPHLYGVEHYGSSAAFRYHNEHVGSIPYGGPIQQSMNVRLQNFASGGSIQFFMARVRKAVDPIPTVTLGAVEPRP